MQKGQWIYKITKTITGIRLQGYEGVYVEGYGDIWEYTEDTREQRVYVEEQGDIWKYKDDTRDGLDGICKTVRE